MQRRNRDFSKGHGFFRKSGAYPERQFISPECLYDVVDSVNRNIHLSVLDLSCSTLGDDGVKIIAQALRSNVTVKTLKLANCQMTDTGLHSLLRMLKYNTTITKIDLSYNLIVQTDKLASLKFILSMNEIYSDAFLYSVRRRTALSDPEHGMPENKLMKKF